ncbi:hypothetical protein GCM10020331_032670 [Ectobacillus funiculus]
MDQRILVGLGNIYVDEVLFRSRIHPEREASSLQLSEIEAMQKEIVATLAEAVEKKVEARSGHISIPKEKKLGRSRKSLYVYGRKGESCPSCGTPIEKTVVGGRGTHYCPICQN